MVLAHVGGFPLEEVAPSLAGGAAAAFVARTWVMMRLRAKRRGRG